MSPGDRLIELLVADHVHFGVGAIVRLPALIEGAGGARAFIVTDFAPRNHPVDIR